MSDDTKPEQKEDEQLDLSNFGDLTPVFSNRFYVFTGPVISKIYFGEIMKTNGEIVYHTSLAVPTVDLIALQALLDRLIQKTSIQVERELPMVDRPSGQVRSLSSGGSPSGSFVMPEQSMEVEVMSPPKIVWYWVFKQNIDRLKDAITVERADKRLEYLFGFGGLAVGTLKDFSTAIGSVMNEETLSFLEFVTVIAFVVSVIFFLYFWLLAEKKEVSTITVFSEIFEKEYEANVAQSSSEAGGGAAGGQIRAESEIES